MLILMSKAPVGTVPVKRRAYTVPQVMQILHVSRLTVYDLIDSGKLPAIRVGNGRRIFPDDLDHFIMEEKAKLRHDAQLKESI